MFVGETARDKCTHKQDSQIENMNENTHAYYIFFVFEKWLQNLM